MSPEPKAERVLTSREAGKLLQVNPSSVLNWVRDGRIRAFRTPGGHVRIRIGDLVSFMRDYEMPIPESLSGLTKTCVVIVDDDRRQLRSLGRVLSKHADRVDLHLVDNGIDALVLVGALRPELVVLDVFMPEVDGLEVCRRLRAHPELANTKIVVTSAQLSPRIEREAMDAGAAACIQKPLTAKALLELI